MPIATTFIPIDKPRSARAQLATLDQRYPDFESIIRTMMDEVNLINSKSIAQQQQQQQQFYGSVRRHERTYVGVGVALAPAVVAVVVVAIAHDKMQKSTVRRWSRDTTLTVMNNTANTGVQSRQVGRTHAEARAVVDRELWCFNVQSLRIFEVHALLVPRTCCRRRPT